MTATLYLESPVPIPYPLMVGLNLETPALIPYPLMATLYLEITVPTPYPLIDALYTFSINTVGFSVCGLRFLYGVSENCWRCVPVCLLTAAVFPSVRRPTSRRAVHGVLRSRCLGGLPAEFKGQPVSRHHFRIPPGSQHCSNGVADVAV